MNSLRKSSTCKRKSTLAILIVFLCILTVTGCSKDTQESIYNFNNIDTKEIDPWIYIQDTTLSGNRQIRNFAASAGQLGITLGVLGIVFSILYMAIRSLFSQNAKAKNEIKEEAIQKGLTAILIFSVPLWLGICKLIAELLV